MIDFLNLKLEDSIQVKMSDIPFRERPYEKFDEFGADYLTDTELLAILIKNGRKGASALDLASQIMALDVKHEGVAFLCNIPTEDLTSVQGIGKVKATIIKSALELGRRASRMTISFGETIISSPGDVAIFLQEEMQLLQYEELRIILLDAKNAVMRVIKGAKGSVSSTMFSPKEIFKDAIKYNAAAIILVHNHPSGKAKPSATDLKTTLELMKLGRDLDIQLLDHVVLAKEGYESIKAHIIQLESQKNKKAMA